MVEESSKEKILPIKIDAMSYEMIGECSFFLNVKDYMNFAITNRTIYCASNSPLTLKELDITETNNYAALDLNRFKLLQSICICPSDFYVFHKIILLV